MRPAPQGARVHAPPATDRPALPPGGFLLCAGMTSLVIVVILRQTVAMKHDYQTSTVEGAAAFARAHAEPDDTPTRGEAEEDGCYCDKLSGRLSRQEEEPDECGWCASREAPVQHELAFKAVYRASATHECEGWSEEEWRRCDAWISPPETFRDGGVVWTLDHLERDHCEEVHPNTRTFTSEADLVQYITLEVRSVDGSLKTIHRYLPPGAWGWDDLRIWALGVAAARGFSPSQIVSYGGSQ